MKRAIWAWQAHNRVRQAAWVGAGQAHKRAGQALPLLLTLLLMLVTISAFAQVSAVPPLMNFQGRLTKPDGTPLPDGTYSLRFSLWTALTAGTEKWNQTQNLTVHNGAFA